MEEQDQAIVPAEEEDWRPRVFVMGGIIGAILGLFSAYLYIRSAEQKYGDRRPPEVPGTGESLRLGMSLLSIIRTISEWGNR